MALDARAIRYTTIAITDTSPIRLDFPAGQYTVTEPVVLVTVSGGPTIVTTTAAPEAVAGHGEVYTHVLLEFDASVVGLRASLAVLGQGF